MHRILDGHLTTYKFPGSVHESFTYRETASYYRSILSVRFTFPINLYVRDHTSDHRVTCAGDCRIMTA